MLRVNDIINSKLSLLRITVIQNWLIIGCDIDNADVLRCFFRFYSLLIQELTYLLTYQHFYLV